MRKALSRVAAAAMLIILAWCGDNGTGPAPVSVSGSVSAVVVGSSYNVTVKTQPAG